MGLFRWEVQTAHAKPAQATCGKCFGWLDVFRPKVLEAAALGFGLDHSVKQKHSVGGLDQYRACC